MQCTAQQERNSRCNVCIKPHKLCAIRQAKHACTEYCPAPKQTCALLIRWWMRGKHPSTADPSSSPMISSGSTSSTVTTAPPQISPLLASRHAELRRRLLVTLVTVSFYCYPSLLTTSLSLFAYYRIDPLEAQMGQSYPQNAQACPSTSSCIAASSM